MHEYMLIFTPDDDVDFVPYNHLANGANCAKSLRTTRRSGEDNEPYFIIISKRYHK